MSTAWNGAAPANVLDAASYTLGVKYIANADITITDLRIFGGSTGTLTRRLAYVFTTAGVTLATLHVPDTMTAGWATYALNEPLLIASGTTFWVAYDTINSYGFLAGAGYPINSADGLVTAAGGGFNSNTDLMPDNASTAFYGVDFAYHVTSGNQRPVAGLSVSATNLSASAVVTITDEAPTTCAVVVEWGDGQTSSGTGPQTFTHTYAAAGTYAVMATVTDTGGLQDGAAAPITVTAPPGALHPTSEQVGVAWLKALGLPAGAVATTLPAPAADGSISWASTGFVQVAGAGGATGVDYRLRMPALGITCWAVSTGSSKPPWGKANQLAEQVITAVHNGSNWRLTNLPAAYARAHVQNARCSEPRRLPDDGGGYARYVFDLYLDWIEVS